VTPAQNLRVQTPEFLPTESPPTTTATESLPTTTEPVVDQPQADSSHLSLPPKADVTPEEPTQTLKFNCVRIPKRRISNVVDYEEPVARTKIHRALLALLEAEEPEEALAGYSLDDINIPTTYEQAVGDPKYGNRWREAIEKEISALELNGTWKETVPPKGSNIVTSKWVFTVKTGVDGTIERFKARLVARGFTQEYGVDYEETFAPTVRMDTLRLFLATVAMEDLELHQVDVNNAFTESDLKETIYMSPPSGTQTSPGTVLQIQRSLYGLKQAARDWNERCVQTLLQLGFIQSLADPCLFTMPGRSLIILLYVDDLPVAAKHIKDILWFKSAFSKSFKIKDLGELQMILGMRVVRDRQARSLTVDQSQYLQKALNDFPYSKHSAQAIPISGYESLYPAGPNDIRINRRDYQKTIGTLMYAMVHTRPDICFALGKLSQYMSDPAEHHGKALKSLQRYLRSSLNTAIQYGHGDQNAHGLIGYTDADWAGDKATRKSTSGYVFMLGGGPVSWRSRKQTAVATSSTESEYVALSAAAKQAVWINQVLIDMGYTQYVDSSHGVDIRGDNQGSLALVKNPHLHERSKHIDICYHNSRDLQKRGKIQTSYVPTADMVADGFTKPLARVQFARFVSMLSLRVKTSVGALLGQ
jgi:hypothetical protein